VSRVWEGSWRLSIQCVDFQLFVLLVSTGPAVPEIRALKSVSSFAAVPVLTLWIDSVPCLVPPLIETVMSSSESQRKNCFHQFTLTQAVGLDFPCSGGSIATFCLLSVS
jgi:hypothetical protein